MIKQLRGGYINKKSFTVIQCDRTQQYKIEGEDD